jgi:hypothetical protein
MTAARQPGKSCLVVTHAAISSCCKTSPGHISNSPLIHSQQKPAVLGTPSGCRKLLLEQWKLPDLGIKQMASKDNSFRSSMISTEAC